MHKPQTIRLHSSDNVIVARVDLPAGAHVEEEGLVCRNNIPSGHKVCTARIPSGGPVRKYSQIIGFATCEIMPGEQVHTHNMEVRDFHREYDIGADAKPTGAVERSSSNFDGIIRKNGSIGTRNYIGVLPTSNCSASLVRYIAEAFPKESIEEFPNVDGILPLPHGTGCGTGGAGEGFHIVQRTVAGYIRHPNFAGVLLVGLGCEENETEQLLRDMRLERGTMFKTMTAQETGGTRKSIEKGGALIQEMLSEANKVKRSRVPASGIKLAVKCGGSDAYSGITANPALGAAADLLVRQGGTAILGESPEIYGAEHLLIRRATNREVGEKLIAVIKWWESYTLLNGSQLNNNPSQGNKAGGLTTIFEKSLGAIAKGGTTNLEAVYRYAEPVTSSGLVFMDTPGYDPVAVTGMVAGGANIVCFTTGRGSLFGCKPVPSIKLASRTDLYLSMEEDMDVNCGVIADGEVDVEHMGRKIFDLILQTASGKRTKSELFGYGENEFIPWHIGVVI